jgi:hypothetical protein
MYEARQFAIFSITGLNQIDFTEVLETAIEKVRIGTDGTLTFVKWDAETPSPSVQALTAQEIQQNFNALRGRFGI